MASATGNATAPRYSGVAMLLHWLIAALVLANIGLAELTEDLSRAARGPYMDIHKACGISVLALMVIRLAWRMGHKPPPFPESMAGWEKALARTTHWIFYGLLIALPLSGWLWMSTIPAPVSYFGLFGVPAWPVAGNEALGDVLHETHEIMGKAIFYLAIFHTLAAFKHLVIDKDGVFGRMLPGRSA
ncbi:cytochrome b [Parasphingopyxis marina]|uniref:Cytochrome b n=1 Tax=Parasphingopyxis marina TaxID=2761622 RepID=A0A842HWQ8_9SPHN|nr:cytochrome b [Parasphingopyxis marina]MBC2777402.1 cytochrome b [Parasphingopyxis marina]